MSTIHHDDALDNATLSADDRKWLERQGRAARALEARQRKLAAERARSAPDRRAASRRRRSVPPPPR